MPKNKICKDGERWQYHVTDQIGKLLVIKSRKGETKSDFRLRCEELDRQAQFGTEIKTLDDLFELWVDSYVRLHLSISNLLTTQNVYKRFIGPYLGNKKLTEITPQHVYRVLDRAYKSVDNGASSAYITKIKSTISRPYNWAINVLGETIDNPCTHVRYQTPAKKKKRKRVISIEDWERIQTAAQYSKYLSYIKLLYNTGLRPSEGLGLQAQDIKKDHIEIRRGITVYGLSDLKTNCASRDIPLTSDMTQLLQKQISKTAMLTPEHWLFPTIYGTPSFHSAEASFNYILKNTAVHKDGKDEIELIVPALHYSLYDFRHTFATRMAEAGMPLKTLQAIIGHKNVSTTMQFYVDITPKMMADSLKYMESN